MAEMKYSEAISLALTEELDRDPNVLLMGEDIGVYQGTFKITAGMYEKYGPVRIMDTPIAELGMVGTAIGMAMSGLRPVVEMMTFNFSLPAVDQIIQNAAKIHYMSGGQVAVPLVIRGPNGAGSQLSAQHSQSLESFYGYFPGLHVVAPGTPADAKGMLKTAIRGSNPVIFLENAGIYGLKGEVPEDPDFTVPFGKANVVRPGRDITIVAYSKMLHLAMAAAIQLASEGIDAEVIDLRSIRPLDMDTVVQSVRKTHRAVVVQEQWKLFGPAAEIATAIYEGAFDYLDAPVTRVHGADVPMPYSKTLEQLALPHEDDIIEAARQALYLPKLQHE